VIKNKNKIMLMSATTAALVVLINTAGLLFIHNSFLPQASTQPEGTFLNNDKEVTAESSETTKSSETRQIQPKSIGSSSATSNDTPEADPNPPLRSPEKPIKVGEPPKPVAVIKTPDGKIIYKWCSGTNTNLEDEVCESILSIVSDPSKSNPYIGEKLKKSLSLMPKIYSLTMDEASWASTSPTTGTMDITVETKSYGNINIRAYMEKINNIWIVNDGKLIQ